MNDLTHRTIATGGPNTSDKCELAAASEGRVSWRVCEVRRVRAGGGACGRVYGFAWPCGLVV